MKENSEKAIKKYMNEDALCEKKKWRFLSDILVNVLL